VNEVDRRLLLALRSAGDPADPGLAWLARAAIDVTALGGHTVLVMLVLSVAGLMVVQQRRGCALWLILTSAGAMLLNHGLKLAFARARPDVVDHLVLVVTPSFPSGHALMSAAIYLAIALVIGRRMPTSASRRYLIGLALALAAGIGLTRVYLGVHWPSDVAGGWLLGAAWVWACWRLRDPRIRPWRRGGTTG
jgi:undecaprenyl-diphosphatase